MITTEHRWNSHPDKTRRATQCEKCGLVCDTATGTGGPFFTEDGKPLGFDQPPCPLVPPPRAHLSAMRDALELTLLFHDGGEWTTERRARWEELTGVGEATTRILCNAIRQAMRKGSTRL